MKQAKNGDLTMKEQALKDKLFIAHIRQKRNELMDEINRLDRLLDTIHEIGEGKNEINGTNPQRISFTF